MQDHKSINEHFETNLLAFEHYYKAVLDGMSMEDIHQLRVSVKKIRANLRLFKAANIAPLHVDILIKILRKLFKRSGKLRELQVHTGVLQHFDAFDISAFNVIIEGKIPEAVRSLEIEMAAFDMDVWFAQRQLLTMEVGKCDAALMRQPLEDELQDLWDDASALLQGELSEDQLHEVRIALKAVHELLVLGQYISLEGRWSEKKNTVKDINQRLGDWHDLSVLKTFIARQYVAFPELLSAENTGLYNSISSEEQEMAVALRQRLLHVFKKTI